MKPSKRIVLIVLAAIAGGVLAAGRPVGGLLERAAGQEHALELDVRLPDGVDVATVAPIWRGRLSKYEVDVAPRGATVHVVVHGARSEDAAVVTGALTEPGKLEMYEVASDTATMRAVYKVARTGELGPDVKGDIDTWRGPSDEPFTDYFLTAHTREALDAAIAAIPTRAPEASLELGDQFAIESITPLDGAEDPRPYWRTYVIRGAPIVDQRHIADATAVWNPQLNRPEVLVQFDDEGRTRFADATEHLVGHKIAIVKDGVVATAPVIQTAITGGRTNITLFGGNGIPQDLAAGELAGALHGGQPPLPPGITGVGISADEPPDAIVWGLRALGAMIVAVAGWLLVIGIARTSTALPGVPRTRRGNASELAIAIAVTVAVPVALWLAERVALPWLDPTAASDLAYRHVRIPNLVTLGMWPATYGFIAGEALAMLIPTWRESRRVQPAAAIFTLWFAILAARGWILGFERWDTFGEQLVTQGWLAITSLVAGAMLFIIGANLISRRGLCNGWVVLIGVAFARGLFRDFGANQVGLALIGAVLAIALVETRSAGRRQPVTSLAPTLVLLNISWVATNFGRGLPGSFGALLRLPWHSTVLEYGVAIATTALLLTLFRVRSIAAIVTAVAIVLAIEWLPHQAFDGALVGVAAIELGTSLLRRVRMGDAAPLLAVREVDRADAAVDALLAAGIPATTEGARMRALLRGFAPWSPVVLYVPADQVDRARSIATPHLLPRLAEAAQVFE